MSFPNILKYSKSLDSSKDSLARAKLSLKSPLLVAFLMAELEDKGDGGKLVVRRKKEE